MNKKSELILTDPRHDPALSQTRLGQFAAKFLRDPRDLPLLRLMLGLLFTLPLSAALILISRQGTFLFAIPYWIFFFGFLMGPYTLMLHNVSHRPFLKAPYRKFQNFVMNWVLGPLFGHTPNSYFAHHIGMHHFEGNLHGDLSCTLHYQRDSFLDFIKYFTRFFCFGFFELENYLLRHRRKKLFWGVLWGESCYFLTAAFCTWWNWRAAVVVFWVPIFILRFGMMAGNWAQHAFVDIHQPDNIFRNSIVAINSKYNRNCFNDGYHLGHHLTPNRHWAEMPDDFLKNRETYLAQDAVIFRSLDYFVIWLFLMLGRFDWLAHFFVDLRETPRTQGEIIALLKERVKKAQPVKSEISASPLEAVATH